MTSYGAFEIASLVKDFTDTSIPESRLFRTSKTSTLDDNKITTSYFDKFSLD